MCGRRRRLGRSGGGAIQVNPWLGAARRGRARRGRRQDGPMGGRRVCRPFGPDGAAARSR
eukprot:9648081-Lingulodinium_polyedra.AAC.1